MEKDCELLVREILRLDCENEWIEFKHNKYSPQMIGEDISALANGATLMDRDYAYMLWGIDDATHKIIGTDFNLLIQKKGNEDISNWLRHQLSDNAEFEYQSINLDGQVVGVLIITRAIKKPVSFQKTAYIRSGSITKKLADLPTLEEKLWVKLNFGHYEKLSALSNLTLDRALQQINFSKYFDALGYTQPSGYDKIAYFLLEDGIFVRQDDGLYSITNLGLLLFAKKLSDYPSLYRKAIRVIQYEGNNRLTILKETTFDEGYAVSLDNAVNYILALLPSREVIGSAVRHTESVYPVETLREALANAVIHQDLGVTGSSILVEIFDGRVEFTNPGIPLVRIERIVDNPPKSRNEALSSLLRRMRLCEELGSGWDRMVINCELRQLPAPRISVYNENTKVTIFSKIAYGVLKEEDRLWSCYLHACIKYIEGGYLTNSSLRERFGVSISASGSISRLIKEAVERKLLKPLDSTTAPRYMKYVPIWA